MIFHIKGNLLDKEYTVFCHQVNCQKVMGSGLAKQIKQQYPEVYQKYKNKEYPYLGDIDWILTNDNRICVNMYAQENYGRIGRYTDYLGFAQCLIKLSNRLSFLPKEEKVAFPDHIGCGLGGGDWKIILALIEDFGKIINQDIYIVRKDD